MFTLGWLLATVVGLVATAGVSAGIGSLIS